MPSLDPSTQNPPPDYEDSSTFHLPTSIPAVKNSKKYKPEGRTIVVCLDGTGDKFDNDNSNIVHFVSCLKKSDRSQATYYQAGIGTYSEGGLSNGFGAAMDMAVGSGLGLHVRDAYHFLMHTYKEGDKICIFGFSRGAYTARCLAGMIHKVGLLPPRNLAQIPFAYDIYKDQSPEGWKKSADFKYTFCIDVNIYFVGVFDSVASVGFIPRTLPLSSTPTSKSHFFRHAMALDERRAKFKLCPYQATSVKEILDPNHAGATKLAEVPEKVSHQSLYDINKAEQDDYSDGHEETEFERQLRHAAPFDTDVSEVWFAGCHADIGGGAVPNEERHKLSQITLRWMIRQCFECNTGILFKTKPLASVGLDVHTLSPRYRNLGIPDMAPPTHTIEKYAKGLPSRSRRAKKLVPIGDTYKGEGKYQLDIFEKHEEEKHGARDWFPEQVEDYFDAMSPMNDQLAVAKTWWILELLPVEYKVQSATSDEWELRTGMNMGLSRAVEGNAPQLHWTVKRLMDAKGYKIIARTGRNAKWQIVS